MIRNRLPSLQKKDDGSDQEEIEPTTTNNNNTSFFSTLINKRNRRTSSGPKTIVDHSETYFSDLSQEILHITENIETIEQNVIDIHDLYSKSLSTVDTQTQEYIMKQIQLLSDETNDMISNLNFRIKKIPEILANADPRLVNTQQYTLVSRLMKITNQYQDVQSKAREQKNAQLVRQYQIAKPEATEEDIGNLDLSSKECAAIFKEAMVSTEKEALEQVKQRHDEIMQIEKSIETLFQSFQDMQNILITNQLMLNSIESFMNHTIINVDKANGEVDEAIVLSKGLNKKKKILFGILLIILIFVVVFLVLFLRKST